MLRAIHPEVEKSYSELYSQRLKRHALGGIPSVPCPARADSSLAHARGEYVGIVIYSCLACARGEYITRWLLVLTIHRQHAGGRAIHEPHRFTSRTQH